MNRHLLRRRYALRPVLRSLLRHEEWNIGIARAPIETFLQPNARPRIDWLPTPPRGSFRADPFGIVHNGRLHVLFERFDYRSGRGQIAHLTLDSARGPGRQRGVLPLPVHSAYPFLLEHQGAIYCIPETGQAHEVALYRALNFPNTWEKTTTLLSGVTAIDSSIFRHGGRWWLACTDAALDPLGGLCLYHASDLVGPWNAHAGNPVKLDRRSARPAGTPFVHEGMLYRPAQDCSSQYGRRVVINRVLRLTPGEFREEPAAIVEPFADSPYRAGIHTLAAVGKLTLVDGKRYVFNRYEAFRASQRTLHGRPLVNDLDARVVAPCS